MCTCIIMITTSSAKAYGMTQCIIFRKLATVILYFHYLSLPVIITGKSEHRDVWYYSMERASIISISYFLTSVQARVSPSPGTRFTPTSSQVTGQSVSGNTRKWLPFLFPSHMHTHAHGRNSLYNIIKDTR